MAQHMAAPEEPDWTGGQTDRRTERGGAGAPVSQGGAQSGPEADWGFLRGKKGTGQSVSRAEMGVRREKSSQAPG